MDSFEILAGEIVERQRVAAKDVYSRPDGRMYGALDVALIRSVQDLDAVIDYSSRRYNRKKAEIVISDDIVDI